MTAPSLARGNSSTSKLGTREITQSPRLISPPPPPSSLDVAQQDGAILFCPWRIKERVLEHGQMAFPFFH